MARPLAGICAPLLALMAGVIALSAAACGSLEASAAKDPMKCERDPKCARHERTFDCSTQCTDDPVCVDRCREMQATTGQSSAH